MKKFSRCVLILILVSVIAGISGYYYELNAISPMYTSTTQLYVVPGEENEASVRASNGGLNNDFMIIFTSGVVISDAQKTAGTTEDISKYLSVSSPANSNIVEITCTNPDQNTAKTYVDAIAKTAIKTTSIIPVKSIQILSEGTASNETVRPDLYKKVGIITGAAAIICLVIEILIVLIINAFKKPEDNSDDELEYEKYFGKYAALAAADKAIGIAQNPMNHRENIDEVNAPGSKKKNVTSKQRYEDMHDILEDFDEDYADDDEYADSDEYTEDRILEKSEESINEKDNSDSAEGDRKSVYNKDLKNNEEKTEDTQEMAKSQDKVFEDISNPGAVVVDHSILKSVFDDVAASIESEENSVDNIDDNAETDSDELEKGASVYVSLTNEEKEMLAYVNSSDEDDEETEEDILAEDNEETEEDILAEDNEETEEDILAEDSEETEEDILAEDSEETEEDILADQSVMASGNIETEIKSDKSVVRILGKIRR